MSTIPPYTYSKLDKAKQEIRLLSLQPSPSLDEPIRITITHVPFIVDDRELPARPKLDEVRRNLPYGWAACETLEGRLLFGHYHSGQNKWMSTWKCPEGQTELLPYLHDAPNETCEPAFEALSYTWGSNAKIERAYVLNEARIASDDITTEATPCLRLDITENLADALRHLRYDNRPRMLWVDAISINQDDVSERSEQVLRMKDLYKHVDRVLVWLGPSSEDSSLALCILEYIGKQLEISLDMDLFPAPGAIEDSWHRPEYALTYNAEVWDSLYDLISRPWFNRLWVTQEIHLTNSQAIIQCGNVNVLWYFFRRGVQCLYSKPHGVPEHLSARLKDIINLCIPSLDLTLGDLLQRYHDRECMDPRDRVYGLLGLASPSSTRNVTPDYSLSTLEAYKSVFLGHASQSRRLELLDLADSNNPLQEWPSWVPDWSTLLKPEDDLCFGFCASVDSPACWNYSDPGILKVVGVQIGTILHRLAVAGGISDLLSDTRPENKNLQYPTGENILDVYTRVRFRNIINETVHGDNSEITLTKARRLMLENSNDTVKNIHFTRYLEETSERWIIRTSERYIGMAPRESKIGKLVKHLRLGIMYFQ